MAEDFAEFKSSYPGIGALLRSEEIGAAIAVVLEGIKQRAEETSIVGDPETDPHSGDYRDGWRAEMIPKAGGRKRDRWLGIVRNIVPYGLTLEKGDSSREGHHILLRAATEGRGEE